ncbi:MAG: SRPBCC family protein [Saprospiraceae bacterium]|nr:SRPBCC family protein [Bacteroidia bacterium]NNK90320.1 SRPBCC family protein [Saprospiraceae bacterium]
MKYTNEIIINLPVKKVIAYFDNPDNMKHWQKGLISFEHQSGEPGQPGARSLLKYKSGKKEVEMVETIKVRNLPEEFSGSYTMKGVVNNIHNSFESIDDRTTKWVSSSEFHFDGIFMKIISFLLPGSFKKQSCKFMVAFKDFAEQSEQNEL